MPLTCSLALLLAALAVAARLRSARAFAFAWFAVAAAVASAHPFTAWLLVRPLEAPQPTPPAPVARVEAIVVLSGGMRPDGDRSMALGEETIARTLCGLDLYRSLGGRPVVVTGGTTPESDGISLAELMGRRLRAEGVPPGVLLEERAAANTFENGLFTARLLEPRGVHRIAVVTDPMHLPRAARVFRALGFEVWPVGCGPLAHRPPRLPWGLVPGGGAAALVDRATHEWLGLAWYAWRGYSR